MRTIALLSLLLLTACDKASQLEYGDVSQAEIRSIAYLRSLCTSESTSITHPISIRGWVTGNDHYGEFPLTLVVEDATGGMMIAIDRSDLAQLFPFGYEVTVNCHGLTLGNYGGKILLGAAPDGHYGVTRIAAHELARYIRQTGQMATPTPKPLTFDRIEPSHIDSYVRFDGVRFTAPGSWCELDPKDGRAKTTERTIVDTQGRTFALRTQGTCLYAKEPVPTGTGSIHGIIDYFNGKYTLRVTNRRVVFATSATSPTTYP